MVLGPKLNILLACVFVCVCVLYMGLRLESKGNFPDWMVKHTIELLSIPLEPVSSSATR